MILKAQSNTTIVNFFGGPCTGKSTTAFGVSYKLKSLGYNVELVTEYAKDKVWEDHLEILDNQLIVFAQQYHRIFRLLGKVDFIITDAPILVSAHYRHDLTTDLFKSLVIETFKGLNTQNYILTRNSLEYKKEGRTQTVFESKEIDDEIYKLITNNNIGYRRLSDSVKENVSTVVEDIRLLNNRKSK